MKLGDLNLFDVGNTIQLAGAIYSDGDHAYLAFFPGEAADLPTDVLELSREDWTTFIRQTDLLETEVIAKSSDGTLAKAVVRKSQRHIEQDVVWAVSRRDGYRCRYCDKNDVPLTVDHLVLWKDGGPSMEANLVAACRPCNKLRGDTDYAAWLRSSRYARVASKLPDTVKALNHNVLSTLDKIPRNTHLTKR